MAAKDYLEMKIELFFSWEVTGEEGSKEEITETKKNFAEGVVTKIYKASPDRIDPLEEHYASCSPWQIMTPTAEDYWKKEATLEMYRKLKALPDGFDVELISDQNKFEHYRNKIEYNFCVNEKGEISYAFFKRNTNDLEAIDGCCLASEAITIASEKVIRWLRQTDLNSQILEKIIFRSNEKGEVMGTLFVKEKIDLLSTPAWDENLVSFQSILLLRQG